jgi:hypothetical protein
VAKSQTSYATNASNNLINQAQGETAPIIGGLATASTNATGAQGTELGAATAGYENQQLTGGYNPTTLSNLQSATGNLASTGGYDPTQLASTLGGYNTLATTGGFTPQQSQQFIEQATQGTTGTYNTLEAQAQQDRAKTGGLGTGGEISQMARQLGQAQASNTLNTEVALNQQQTGNELAGLGGSSNLQTNVAGAKAGGVAQEAALGANVAAGSNAANTGLSNLYNTTTGQITAVGQQVLSALGLNFNTQSDAITALTNLSKNPGAVQTVLGTIAGLGGAAAGAAGALGIGA